MRLDLRKKKISPSEKSEKISLIKEQLRELEKKLYDIERTPAYAAATIDSLKGWCWRNYFNEALDKIEEGLSLDEMRDWAVEEKDKIAVRKRLMTREQKLYFCLIDAIDLIQQEVYPEFVLGDE